MLFSHILGANNFVDTRKKYRATGTTLERSEPSMRYTVHPFELTEDDKHRIKMDSAFIPKPRVSNFRPFGFNLPVSSEIRLVQDFFTCSIMAA